jgi:hypothetical protein
METAPFSLAMVQQWMQSMLMGNGAEMPGNERPLINDIVNASSRLSAARHFNIYQGSYIARLRECMRTQFATLAYALGTELFDAFTDQYLATYPSGSYTLNELGKRFASFLRETRPDAGQEHKEDWPDFMIELAEFEFSVSLIFDEAANENSVIADNATADELLVLSPVFHLFKHSYPVTAYYLDYANKKEPELPFARQSYCVVTRQNYRLGLFVIKPAQHYFLSLLQKGVAIPLALREVAGKYDLAPEAMAGMWKEWRNNFITSGLFVCRQAS